MNIQEITDTIKELEQTQTTFDNCRKLATLYVVRDNLQHDDVIREYNDILPSYDKYVHAKRMYQLNKVSLESVENEFRELLREISEFIDTLINTTETTSERALILATIDTIKKTH